MTDERHGDGRADTWNVPRRTGSSTYVDAMDREYVYSLDGSSMGWATSCADDEDRTFLYDGGNRLVCVTDEAASEECPEGTSSPLLEAFTYDESDSRTGYRDPSGTTTYTLDGAAIIEEDPPGAFEIEQFYEFTDGGARTEDGDTGIAEATCEFLYDGLRRLRTVTLKRPASPEDEYDDVTITVHYDHRARPYLVSVVNDDTDVEERNRYYNDLEDRVITWTRTPDTSTAGTFDVRQYVQIGDLAVGEMARSWVNFSATRHTEPLGLETAAFEFEHPGGASVSYNPSTVVRQWTAFGRPLVATGSGVALPTRFPGQIELRGSNVRVWDDSSVVAHRDGLYLNRWRAYDPRVGQYLQPDPTMIVSRRLAIAAHGYVDANPGGAVDRDGRESERTFADALIGFGYVVNCAPASAVGHLLGLLGSSTAEVGGLTEYYNVPVVSGPAVTVGDVILYSGDACDPQLSISRPHERAHPDQFHVMGNSYIPFHLAAQATSRGISLVDPLGRRQHYDAPGHTYNPCEWGPLGDTFPGHRAAPWGLPPWLD